MLYFNQIFDSLSKLAADSEVSVKNGAELLDRLLKDIVCETAPEYVSRFQDIPHIRSRQDAEAGYSGGTAELDVAREKASPAEEGTSHPNKTFSLARFVPLLSERMYVLSPFTRNYLVGWITVLDSVPDLELVTYLPHFLDGLLKYLSDPNTDVRLATANVLAEFLREIKEAAAASSQKGKARASGQEDQEEQQPEQDGERAEGSGSGEAPEKDDAEIDRSAEDDVWEPGRDVRIDFTAIMDILIGHITYPDEEIQATTLQWIAELLLSVKDVVVPFAPRLLPAILPNLAHHSPAIQAAANNTNFNLYQVIEDLPAPVAMPPRSQSPVDSKLPKTDTAATSPTQGNTAGVSGDPFEYQATVNTLALQLLDQHEETRVNALEWLLMLHRKSPQRILTMHDGTFPALLKTLSDPSEEVIRCDLRLLAQISSASEDSYFSSFMANLLSLFSTDRRLLETRGSLIIRQLCASLHTERIFRTLSELLEKDEDLEFAGIMIQNLNIILITSPELADFRRRLKNHDSKDGQQLFTSLYRSWCHNAVAAFSLCLLAQVYEHASNLLSILGDLEITVAMLIQIDKLVQLLESPIFTALRLQLLDPDKNPFLLKSLYGLLMLLPQSSAFATLRNRLSAVSSMGPGIRSTYAQSGRSKVVATGAGSGAVGRDEIKWSELLTHFRVVQSRHERARRAAAAAAAAATTSAIGGQEMLLPGLVASKGGAAPGAAAHGSRAASASSTSMPITSMATAPPTPAAKRRIGAPRALTSSAPQAQSNSRASSAPFGNTGNPAAASNTPGLPITQSRATSPISSSARSKHAASPSGTIGSIASTAQQAVGIHGGAGASGATAPGPRLSGGKR